MKGNSLSCFHIRVNYEGEKDTAGLALRRFILEFVDKNPDIKDYKKILQDDIMLEDYHWNWSKKAFYYNTSNYIF
jgi:predicted nucleotidyltransferase